MPENNFINIALECWGAAFCFIALFCSHIIPTHEPARQKCLTGMLTVNMLLLVWDSVAWGFRGNPTVLGYWAVRVSNFFVFALPCVLCMAYVMYIDQAVQRREGKVQRIWYRLIGGTAAILLLLLVATQFTGLFYTFDESNTYHRMPGYIIDVVLYYSMFAMILALLLVKRKWLTHFEFLSVLMYIIIPLLATTIQVLNYGLSLIHIGTTVAVLLMFMADTAERSRRLTEQEHILHNAQVALLRTQMQPHFIFNSLNSINALILTDPMAASEAVSCFADFVRASLDTMDGAGLIPFSDELRIVEKYLEMEKIRFGSHLNVVYEIEDRGFMLPAFTLQPIAENAVRHGLCKKLEPGTLTITARLEQDRHVIEIIDDGTGYDTTQNPSDDGRVHIGMENVSTRLRLLCRGAMTVHSEVGKGTCVRIEVPVG